MRTLIDGYNLLHAIGRLTPRHGKNALEGARRALLLQVKSGHSAGEEVTVVFDAGAAPPGAPAEEVYEHIHFRFAHEQTADDLIEEIIRDEPNPRLLAVVSDDHRIQHAARRKGCTILGCLDYYERLQQPVPVPPAPSREVPAKPDSSTSEEKQQWMEAFRDIEDDPQMREGF
jgi:predicted RNA-binding protein with PIN domain